MRARPAPRVRTRDYATARHLQQQRASTRASRGPVLLAVAYSPRAGSGGVGQGLAPKSTTTNDLLRIHSLAVPFSRDLEDLNPNCVLHAADNLLPEHLRSGRRLVSWRAASPLSSTLITYRFNGGV